jgi:hypothetical protein
MVVDHGQPAVFGKMDVAFDDVDSELDGGPKRGQGVLRALVRVTAVTTEQDPAAAEP